MRGMIKIPGGAQYTTAIANIFREQSQDFFLSTL